jgi:hypothetical protein
MKKSLLGLLFLLAATPAFALTCAHVETGQALDPQPCATIGSYLARYTAQVTQGWNVVVVPDGTQHNAVATQNQDGTWSTVNPTPVAARPAPLSVTDFKKRFTFAERTALLSSADAGVKVFLDELNTATAVRLDDPDTVAGMNYVVGLGLLTAQRRDQILAP